MQTTPFDLTGKVAIVTGGNGGIGLGMARGLARAGASIVIAGRNKAKSEDAVRDIEMLGAKALAVTVDVTDKVSVADMVETTLKQLGRLDILINNAGTSVRHPAHMLSLEDWHTVIDTNLLKSRLSGDERSRWRQDHQHRLNDVDFRRELRARLCRQQRRHRAVHQVHRVVVGGR